MDIAQMLAALDDLTSEELEELVNVSIDIIEEREAAFLKELGRVLREAVRA